MLPIRQTLLATALALTSVAAPLALTASPAGAVTDPNAFYVETNPGQVGGTYVPVVGDFSDVAYYDDILWYAPGAAGETLWTAVGNRKFSSKPLGNVVDGTLTPLVGDFTGDELDDIFWFGSGAKPDALWRSSGAGTFANVPVSAVTGSFAPVVLEDETGKDDILWVNPAGGAGRAWSFTGTGSQHQSHAITTVAGTKPLVGDFDGNGNDDVFWYGPGAIPDALWSGNGAGVFAAKAQTVGGSYTPLVAQLTPVGAPEKTQHGTRVTTGGHDLYDDILWNRPTGAISVWYGRADRAWSKISTANFNTAGTLLPGSADGTVLIWSPTQPDKIWSDGGLSPTGNTEIGSGYSPIVGNWNGSPGVLFYKPGPAPEILFT
ncbi:MAG: hypothetical protein JWM47_1108 [Acidimicrobiales bacterium]|nr:hypothetical protein [Acidimicrobiales bacterium]